MVAWVLGLLLGVCRPDDRRDELANYFAMTWPERAEPWSRSLSMEHQRKWLEGESWSDHLSVKVILTGLCASLAGLCAVRIFGVF
jgi:hypothetical protein